LLYFCNEEGERMEKMLEEDSVLSMAKEVESEFWADEREREMYFQHQQLLMDAYSDEHTYEILLRQEREKSERALQEKERALLAMARNLLKLGDDMGRIVQVSGLSEEEIRGGA
jgi:hypothetical protein